MRGSKSGSATTSADIGQHLTDLARQELDALRATLDLRLAALESALESPGDTDSLERLVLDLARVATDEAAAASRQAALHAEVQARRQVSARDAEHATAVQAFDTERAALNAAVAAERATAAELQRAVDEARKALAAKEASQDAALRGAREAQEKAVAQARLEHATALDEERAERATLQQAIDAERQARAQIEGTLDAERQARARAEATLVDLQAAGEAERHTSAELGAALAAEREGRVRDRAALSEERAAREQERATYETAASRLADSLATLQHELDEARADLEQRGTAGSRADTETLERRQAELVQALNDAEAGAEATARDHDTLGRERDAVMRERDTLARERDGLRAEHDAMRADLERAIRDLDLARTGTTSASSDAGERFQAIEAERNKLLTALREAETLLDTVMRERDVSAAKLDAAREAAEVAQRDALARYQQLQRTADERIRELELELLGRPANSDDDVELASALATDEGDVIAVVDAPAAVSAASPAGEDTTEPASGAPSAPAFGPPRRANRLAFTKKVNVQIDGAAAVLQDLSVTGAQVVSEGALKPNRVVKLVLPGEPVVTCRGKVVWARLETQSRGGLRYRAGVLFTDVREPAIEAFMAHHADEQ